MDALGFEDQVAVTVVDRKFQFRNLVNDGPEHIINTVIIGSEYIRHHDVGNAVRLIEAVMCLCICFDNTHETEPEKNMCEGLQSL